MLCRKADSFVFAGLAGIVAARTADRVYITGRVPHSLLFKSSQIVFGAAHIDGAPPQMGF